MRSPVMFVAGLLLVGSGYLAVAQEFPIDDDAKSNAQREYSPYVSQNFPNRVYWGDTHVHTSFSFDAGFLTTLGPEDAYRYARPAPASAQSSAVPSISWSSPITPSSSAFRTCSEKEIARSWPPTPASAGTT
jgi:hypothetical protein